MKPYYQRNGTTIFVGDAREIVPQLQAVNAIITDPVWPNCPPGLLTGSEDPYGLLAATLEHAQAERVVIQMGCNSDPRFLNAVPSRWPFFRACYLEYVPPSRRGRLLYDADVAYAFGSPPPSKVGARVIPGHTKSSVVFRSHGHPTERRLSHAQWLVKWFAAGTVLDPFCGSGTTLEAARICGYPAIGIEINEAYADIAVRRLQQEAFDMEVVA